MRLPRRLILTSATSLLTFTSSKTVVAQQHFMSTSMLPSAIPISRDEWRQALSDLPQAGGDTGRKIPAFFFAHGNPSLVWPESVPKPGGSFASLLEGQGPESPLANFLQDFGPALVEKYNPRGVIVFSAHWEETDTMLVTDYEGENPLLYDYYGFDKAFYDIKFASKGDSSMSKRVVSALQEAGIGAKTLGQDEPRGRDGRGVPGRGLDHGVFVPFKHMFGDSCQIPIVEVSIDESLVPEKNWALGKAVDRLRSEGYLILSGGLTIHTFQDFTAWKESTADATIKSFHSAILDAVKVSEIESRKTALTALIKHPGFRKAHPREEHFVPIYVAAGAGEDGEARILSGAYGAPTFAFGI